MALVVFIAALVLPWIFAFYAIRADQYKLVMAILFALAAALAWGIWKGQQYHGFDGLGYVLFAMLVAAPAILGTLLGWLTGWVHNRRQRATLARRAVSE